MLDKYLEMHTSTISVTSRREKHPPAQKMYISRGKNIYQHNKYLSESYAVYAVGSTSSNVKNILDFITLLHKYNGRYMAFRWKIDWFL